MIGLQLSRKAFPIFAIDDHGRNTGRTSGGTPETGPPTV